MINVRNLEASKTVNSKFRADQVAKAGIYYVFYFWDPEKIYIEDREPIITEPYAMLIMTPGTFINQVAVSICTYSWMILSGDVDSLMKKYNIEFNKIFYPKDKKRIIKQFSTIANTYVYHDDDTKALVEQTEELFKIVSSDKKQRKLTVDKHTRMRFDCLREEMRVNYAEKWTLDSMTALVGCSRPYFSALYREIYDVPPIKDLILIRIDAAKKMLENDDMSLSKISESVGYNDYTHFVRQFTLYAGETPASYRKTAREKNKQS